MKYMNNTDLTISPAALIRHLHSHGFLAGDSEGEAEPLDEVKEVRGEEGRLAEYETQERQSILADAGPSPEGLEVDGDLPEEYYHGLEDLPWSLSALEQALYLSLPTWVHAALLCNLLGHVVRSDEPGFSLPVRLMSYLLLPYTLPVTAIFQLNYRLMRLADWEKTNLLKCFRGVRENIYWRKWNRRFQDKAHWLSWIRGLHEKSCWLAWITGLQEKAQWLWQELRQVVRLLVRVSVSSLKTILPDRLPSFSIALPRFPVGSLQSLKFIPLSIPSVSLCSLSFLTPSLLLRILPLRFFSFGSAPQSEPGQVSGTTQRQRRSVLRFHLSTSSSAPASDSLRPSFATAYSTDAPSTFSLLFDLQLEVDEQPEVYPVQPLMTALPVAHFSPEEVEDEGLCSPHISFLSVREEDVKDEDSDEEDSGKAPSQGPPVISLASERSPKSVQLHALHSSK